MWMLLSNLPYFIMPEFPFAVFLRILLIDKDLWFCGHVFPPIINTRVTKLPHIILRRHKFTMNNELWTENCFSPLPPISHTPYPICYSIVRYLSYPIPAKIQAKFPLLAKIVLDMDPLVLSLVEGYASTYPLYAVRYTQYELICSFGRLFLLHILGLFLLFGRLAGHQRSLK